MYFEVFVNVCYHRGAFENLSWSLSNSRIVQFDRFDRLEIAFGILIKYNFASNRFFGGFIRTVSKVILHDRRCFSFFFVASRRSFDVWWMQLPWEYPIWERSWNSASISLARTFAYSCNYKCHQIGQSVLYERRWLAACDLEWWQNVRLCHKVRPWPPCCRPQVTLDRPRPPAPRVFSISTEARLIADVVSLS